jgi:hypothetical protein
MDDDQVAIPKKRGRPRSQIPTVIVPIRLPQDVHDWYCRASGHSDIALARICRMLLTKYARRRMEDEQAAERQSSGHVEPIQIRADPLVSTGQRRVSRSRYLG